MVHGFLAGLLLVGVRAPVLSVAGDITPSSGTFISAPDPGRAMSGVALLDFRGGGLLTSASFFSDGGTGDAAPLAGPLPSFAAASRSALSCCLRSFLRSRFARSRSALSAAALLGALPLARGSFGVSRPDNGFVDK